MYHINDDIPLNGNIALCSASNFAAHPNARSLCVKKSPVDISRKHLEFLSIFIFKVEKNTVHTRSIPLHIAQPNIFTFVYFVIALIMNLNTNIFNCHRTHHTFYSNKINQEININAFPAHTLLECLK